MNAVVIEHVDVAKLPAAWRKKLSTAEGMVTVRIEAETPSLAKDPAFGMWKDREDMADVDAYVRKLRAPRYKTF